MTVALGRMLFRGQFYPPNTDLGYRVPSGLGERRYGLAGWLLAADIHRGANGLLLR